MTYNPKIVRFACTKRALKSIAKLIAAMVVTIVIIIVAWEQVDDKLEAKWNGLFAKQYVAAVTTDTSTDEDKTIAKYIDSPEAQELVKAWAKGKAADNMRKRAEELSQESREVSLGFE